MTVVSSKEFATNQKQYFDMALNEQVIVKSGEYMFHIKGLYNSHIQKRLLLEKVLQEESKAVHTSSMEVLKDFESIDYELQTI